MEDHQKNPKRGSAETHYGLISVQSSGIIDILKESVGKLLAQFFLPENPYAALVAMLHHRPLAHSLWGPAEYVQKFATPPVWLRPDAPVLNKIQGIAGLQPAR